MTVEEVQQQIEAVIDATLRKSIEAAVFEIHRLYSTERYVDGDTIKNLIPNTLAYNKQKSARGGDHRRGHDTRAANRFLKRGSYVKVKDGTLAIDMSGAQKYFRHYLERKAPGFGHISKELEEKILKKVDEAVDVTLNKLLQRLPDGSYMMYES